MVKKLLLPVLLFSAFCAQATFVPVSLSGFNHDAVANGVGGASTSTTLAVDQSDWNLVAPDFKAVATDAAPTAALPANGLINSANTAGLSFQLANYTGNNDLILSAVNAPATLTFGTNYSGNVYVLGFTGNGTTTADIRVNFTDNTAQTFTGVSFSDWYNGTGFAIDGIGRVQRLTNVLEAPAGNPRMYEAKLTISAANAGKQIAGITVTKTNATGVLNIMAVSVCQSPMINSQPVDKYLCKNGNTFFNVVSPNAVGYQWEVNQGSGFVNVTDNAIYSGATTAMLNLTQVPATYNNYQYRCGLKSSCGATVYTQVSTLFVTDLVSITAIPTKADMCIDGTATIKIENSGKALNYKWQVKTVLTGAYADLPNAFPYVGVNTDVLEILKAPDTLQNATLRCIITGECNVVVSADIPVSMITSPYFSKDPVDANILPYENAWFESQVLGSNQYILYWQSSTNGVDFVNINDNSLYMGSKAIRLVVFNTQPSLHGMKFRCILKTTNPTCGQLRDTTEAAKINIQFPNDVDDISKNETLLSVYPNPVMDNTLHISATGIAIGTEVAIEVYDVLGKTLYAEKAVLSSHNKVLLPASIVPGIYRVNIYGKNIQKSMSILKK